MFGAVFCFSHFAVSVVKSMEKAHCL